MLPDFFNLLFIDGCYFLIGLSIIHPRLRNYMFWEILKCLRVQELLGQSETAGLPTLMPPCSLELFGIAVVYLWGLGRTMETKLPRFIPDSAGWPWADDSPVFCKSFFAAEFFCTAFGTVPMRSPVDMLVHCSVTGETFCVYTGLWSMVKHPGSDIKAGINKEEYPRPAHTPFTSEGTGDLCDLKITFRVITQRHCLWHKMFISSYSAQ